MTKVQIRYWDSDKACFYIQYLELTVLVRINKRTSLLGIPLTSDIRGTCGASSSSPVFNTSLVKPFYYTVFKSLKEREREINY